MSPTLLTTPIWMCSVLELPSGFQSLSFKVRTVGTCREWAPERTTILVKGVYDLLHTGHVHSFLKAKERAETLVVGVASDDSVRRRKGAGRPYIALPHRVAMVASLGCVDFVTVYDEASPFGLIDRLRPHFFGASHLSFLSDAEVSHLGRQGVEFIRIEKPPYDSTTQIVTRIQEEFNREP